MRTQFTPKGFQFSDKRSGREMMFVYEGEWAGWLVYKHPDGQWVSLRKATEADLDALPLSIARCSTEGERAMSDPLQDILEERRCQEVN